MNYFGHAILVLPLGRPLSTAGAVLPDLLRYVGARRTHRPIRDLPTDGALREGFEDVARGVAAHLRADAAFHVSPSFREVLGRLDQFVASEAVALADHWTRWLLPHVVTELVLDRLLVRAEPAAAEACYEAVETLRGWEGLGALCERQYGVARMPVQMLLGQWVSNRRLHTYETLDGVRMAVERTLGRRGRRVIENGQARAFAQLVRHAEVLIGDPHRLLPVDQAGG